MEFFMLFRFECMQGCVESSLLLLHQLLMHAHMQHAHYVSSLAQQLS